MEAVEDRASAQIRSAEDVAARAAEARVVDLRAQAAMMVEAIEDRALAEIAEARAEAAFQAAEAQRLRTELMRRGA